MEGRSPSHHSWPTLVPSDWHHPRSKEKPRPSEDGNQTATEVGAVPEVSWMTPGPDGLGRPPRGETRAGVDPAASWDNGRASAWRKGCHVIPTIQVGHVQLPGWKRTEPTSLWCWEEGTPSFHAGGVGSIPGQETKIPHVVGKKP